MSNITLIFLTGFMGTGKSTVGKVLAEQLGFTLSDLDARVVEHAGKSVKEIFRLFGEPYFRNLETGVLKELETAGGMVVATGGGVVIRPENRRLMHDMGIIINLTASPEEIVQRLQHERQRPLLEDDRSLEKIRAMLAEREPFYADADCRIVTDGKKAEEIAGEITAWLKHTRTIF